MIDLDTGENIKTLYRFVEIRGGKRTEKFKTPDIKRALKFHNGMLQDTKKGFFSKSSLKKKFTTGKKKGKL